MTDFLETVRRAVGDTPLMVPGNLRDLLCASAYANDHVIGLLLRDVATNAILAVLDAIAEPSEAQQNAAGDYCVSHGLSGARMWSSADFYRAMIAALKKEIEP